MTAQLADVTIYFEPWTAPDGQVQERSERILKADGEYVALLPSWAIVWRKGDDKIYRANRAYSATDISQIIAIPMNDREHPGRDELQATDAPYGRCACGKTLDSDGEHAGGYGAFCGDGPVLGHCPHGVDLDTAFCPQGCRR